MKYSLPVNYTLDLPSKFKFGYYTDVHFQSEPPLGRFDDYPQSIMSKIDYIFDYFKKSECAFTVCGGDFLNSVAADNNRDSLRHDMSTLLRKYNFPNFIVPGNHDFHGSLDYLMDCPLSWFISNGLLKPFVLLQINTEFVLMGVPYLSNHPEVSSFFHDRFEMFGDTLSKQNSSDYFVMFVIHQLVENAYYAKYGVNFEYLKKFNPQCVFVGHDHTSRLTYENHGMTFIQPGSVSRYHNSAEEHKHVPKFCVVSVDLDSRSYDVNYIEIPCETPNKVFYMTKRQVSNDIDSFREYTKELGDTLFKSGEVTNRVSTKLRDLIQQNSSPEVFSFIENYLSKVGL